MMNKKDLAQFRSLLTEVQSRLRGDVQHLTNEALDPGSESKSPTHMAELGTETFEQDFVLGVMERDQEVLGEISQAIKRVDTGVYGQCEGCVAEGKAPSRCGIPKLRLKEIPWARNCVECARKVERAYA
ncbi:General stress protein 16O [Caulifigura coniformis]|uniref:General stress protein 16O n=1 Tax=Caulifigura coniformis TaxID=2527983 RepID=A0A517SB94_9PLAN|nr:TraR/DksA family transcriptional regulator [Caulifigura coniformis]QDT53395.1 General stress protein 16O [Caulifigura coniformis]